MSFAREGMGASSAAGVADKVSRPGGRWARQGRGAEPGRGHASGVANRLPLRSPDGAMAGLLPGPGCKGGGCPPSAFPRVLLEQLAGAGGTSWQR